MLFRSIRQEFAGARVSVAKLDLGDLACVRQMAADWLASVQVLDILVNNAAIMACPLTRTVQGWEAQFATNHLGASTSVWAATALALKGKGGMYLEDCRQGVLAEPSNRVSGYSPHIMDSSKTQRLWDVSEALLAA